MSTFDPVPSRVAFPQQEEGILDLWRERDVFRRSVTERPADRIFTFYEGPPTANGNPGIHHVLARVFKDLIPRYRTMRGDRVPRKGGWDTHGLPVELEVEKQLGLSSKQEIEAYGVEAFNRQCRESVFRYVAEWERMTDRIGFWIDTEDAYVTFHPQYVESAWWIFKRLWDHDLMYREFRVTPHCPRCETSLSSHEIAQGYEDDTPDPGVTLRFRLPADAVIRDTAREALRLADGVPTSLLAWTTTPWTLSGNTALAVAPEATYALVERTDDHLGRERVIVANDLARDVVGAMSTVYREDDANLDEARELGQAIRLSTFPGTMLLGLEYEPVYEASALT